MVGSRCRSQGAGILRAGEDRGRVPSTDTWRPGPGATFGPRVRRCGVLMHRLTSPCEVGVGEGCTVWQNPRNLVNSPLFILPCIVLPRVLGLDRAKGVGELGQLGRRRGLESAARTWFCLGLSSSHVPGPQRPPSCTLACAARQRHSPTLPASAQPACRAWAPPCQVWEMPLPIPSHPTPLASPRDFVPVLTAPGTSQRPKACRGLLRGDQKRVRVPPTWRPLMSFRIVQSCRKGEFNCPFLSRGEFRCSRPGPAWAQSPGRPSRKDSTERDGLGHSLLTAGVGEGKATRQYLHKAPSVVPGWSRGSSSHATSLLAPRASRAGVTSRWQNRWFCP